MSMTPPSEPVLRREQDDGIAVLTLDRPEAMNALSIALRRELTHAFREIAADGSVGVVILTGRGRAFCAGLDLKEMAGETDDAASGPAAMLSEGDILSCDTRTIREIKRVYAEGWATSLEEGLRLEAVASRSFARSVSASDVAARRRGIQERGRSQSS